MTAKGQFVLALSVIPLFVFEHHDAIFISEIVGFSLVPRQVGLLLAKMGSEVFLLLDVVDIDVSFLHHRKDNVVILVVVNDHKLSTVFLACGQGTVAIPSIFGAKEFVEDTIGLLLVASRGLGSATLDAGTRLTRFSIW